VLSLEEALQHEDLQPTSLVLVSLTRVLITQPAAEMNCGFDSEREPEDRITISIEKDVPTTETAMATYNVDSYIVPLASLGAAKLGIKCILIQKATPSIRSSLHLGTFSAYLHSDDDLGDVKQVQVTLDKIPHILLVVYQAVKCLKSIYTSRMLYETSSKRPDCHDNVHASLLENQIIVKTGNMGSALQA